MSKFPSRHIPRVLFIVVACVLALAQPASLSAQKRKPIPTPPVKPPTVDSNNPSAPNVRTSEQAALEMQLLLASRGYESDLERERRAIANQLARDLDRLQQINHENIIPLSSAKSVDYKALAKASAEINERAKRIKYNVPLSLARDKTEKTRFDADPSKLGSMMPTLSRSITSFLTNPVFQISAPNDDELRARAGRDLETIIKLSDTISKIARRLAKT